MESLEIISVTLARALSSCFYPNFVEAQSALAATALRKADPEEERMPQKRLFLQDLLPRMATTCVRLRKHRSTTKRAVV